MTRDQFRYRRALLLVGVLALPTLGGGALAAHGPLGDAVADPTDTRCDTHSCTRVRLGDAGPNATFNVLSPEATAGAPATGLYWGDAAVWTSRSDGPGSGLDADTLDGVSSEDLLARDAALSDRVAALKARAERVDERLDALDGRVASLESLVNAGDYRGGSMTLDGDGQRSVRLRARYWNDDQAWTVGANGHGFFVADDSGPGRYGLVVKKGSGNVGVGTTAPAARLHVAGALRADGDATADAFRSDTFVAERDGKSWHVNVRKGGFNVAETSVADARLFLAPGGNVGIGTDAPASRLTVAGPVESTSGGYKFPGGSEQEGAVVAAFVGGNGRVLAGDGLRVEHVRTGAYRIFLEPRLPGYPVAVVTPANGGYTGEIQAVSHGSTQYVQVGFRDANGAFANTQFMVLVTAA